MASISRCGADGGTRVDLDAPDPVIHQSARFRIMLLLYRNRQAAATWVKDALSMTDGNLRSHADKLAQAGYIELGRALTRDGFQVRLRITSRGHAAFRAYLHHLERILDAATSAGADDVAAALPQIPLEKQEDERP